MVMMPVDLDSLSKAELKERHLDLLERFCALEEQMRALTGQSHMKNSVGGSMQRNPYYEQRNAPTRVPLRSGTLDPS